MRRLALAVVLGTLFSLSPGLTAEAAAVSPECKPGLSIRGGCPEVTGSIRRDTVELEGTQKPPSSGPSTPPRTPPGTTTPTPTPTPVAVPVEPPFWDEFVIVEPVTLADLASFRPNTGSTRMEPNGWAIAGLPTNFWIDTSPHTLTGTLLERPATVRFTPVAARFDYGDGSAVVRTPLGGSWDAAGVDEFDTTSTSHIYRRTGTVTVTPRVDFTAEYSWNDGTFTPIAGTLTTAGTARTITVVRATTVLVSGDCNQAPAGPGC